MLADDLVNDMYFKLIPITKQIKDSYVKRVILNLFYDHLRSRKKIVSIDNVQELNIDNIDFELDDYKLSLLDKLTDEEKYYLELNFTMSLRQIGKEVNRSYSYVYRVIKRAKNKI